MPSDINEDEIDQHIKKRLQESRKNATINRELAALRRMIRIALQAMRILSNT